jgi:NAD(P)-dependent dehydrogenase (short-subunit alcohol dehydrogenase family)
MAKQIDYVETRDFGPSDRCSELDDRRRKESLMKDGSRQQSVAFPFKLALATAAAAATVYAVRQCRRMDFEGKTVVIAGGSRGLGLELARGFAKEGANVVLLARNRRLLAEAARELEAAGASISVLGCDVTKQDEVRINVASIIRELKRIDVLINVAGMIQVGPSEHMQLDDFAEAMAVHFWGPLYLMEEVIPHMKRERHGRIVNIASIGGKVAVPHLLPYAASKFALVGLSEGMRTELVKDGIYVTTVCPGLMRTGSHFNALFKGQQRKEFALFSVANALLSTSSARAVRQIMDACRYGASQLVITPQARLLRLVNGVFPTFVAEALSLVCRVLPGPGGAEGAKLKRGWESQSSLAPSLVTRPADRAATDNKEEPQPAVPS